jgi:hypothetical protein
MYPRPPRAQRRTRPRPLSSIVATRATVSEYLDRREDHAEVNLRNAHQVRAVCAVREVCAVVPGDDVVQVVVPQLCHDWLRHWVGVLGTW